MCPLSTYGLSCYSCLSEKCLSVDSGGQDSAVISIALILAWLAKDRNADWKLLLLQILFLTEIITGASHGSTCF